MEKETSMFQRIKSSHAVRITVALVISLIIVLLVQTIFGDMLWDASHKVITDIQIAKDDPWFDFYEFINQNVDHSVFTAVILILIPYMHAERTWYLLIAVHVLEWWKNMFKMGYH